MSTLKNNAAQSVEEGAVDTQPRERKSNGRFAEGNTAGFQPGQSGNPKGRPRGVRYLSEAFRFWLAANNETNPRETNADAIAAIVGKAALAGDLKACELLLNRTEGKPKDELPNRYNQFSGYFGEDAERLQIEQEIYYEMEDEGLDFDEVLSKREEREAEEEREREKAVRAEKRHLKALERAFDAADQAIDAGESVDFDDLEELISAPNWYILGEAGICDDARGQGFYEARLDAMRKCAAARKRKQ